MTQSYCWCIDIEIIKAATILTLTAIRGVTYALLPNVISHCTRVTGSSDGWYRIERLFKTYGGARADLRLFNDHSSVSAQWWGVGNVLNIGIPGRQTYWWTVSSTWGVIALSEAHQMQPYTRGATLPLRGEYGVAKNEPIAMTGVTAH